MSNQIRLEKDKKVKIFPNQQKAAEYLGVTKQAVAKALKNQSRCNGARLTVLYHKCAYTDKSKSLIIDGKLVGSYERIERKNGNVFVIGFIEE